MTRVSFSLRGTLGIRVFAPRMEPTCRLFRRHFARAPRLSHTPPVPGEALYDELCRLLGDSGVEVRVEPFQKPSERGGGLCVVRGKRLVILDQGASRPERARALLEAIEHLEVGGTRLRDLPLSPELRRQLNRRGQMPWPNLRQAPGLARCEPDLPEEPLGPRLVKDPARGR